MGSHKQIFLGHIKYGKLSLVKSSFQSCIYHVVESPVDLEKKENKLFKDIFLKRK